MTAPIRNETRRLKKKIFITWERHSTRSHNQARHFGAREIYIYPFGSSKNPLILLLRYVASFFMTLAVLWRERPAIIFCLNQPPFLVLAVYLHTRIFGGEYILDSHSAAFNDPKWAWFRPMYRIIARRAFLNINTNTRHRQLVESWGGRSRIVSDVPIDHESEYPPLDVAADSIAVVASYMFDEPIAEILEAARLCPEVRFYLTGDSRRLGDRVENVASNVTFTGYLSRQDYFRLMSSVKAVMALTTRDDTMQMGAYEALSLAQPIITSRWPVLEESFGDAACYVDNTPGSIAAAVRRVMANHEPMKQRAAARKALRRRVFEDTRSEILSMLNAV